MMLNFEHLPLIEAVERLGEASLKVGMTQQEVMDLLSSELELSQLLEYVEAVLSHRVH